MPEFSVAENERRRTVMTAILSRVVQNEPIKLPDFDAAAGSKLGAEPNPYNGLVGELAYQFEGEDDLLHLIVTRDDGAPCAIASAQDLAAWLLQGVPSALIWFKPGTVAHHFYVGHDDLPKVVT